MEIKARRIKRRLSALIPWLFFFAAVVMQQIAITKRGEWMKSVNVRLIELQQQIEQIKCQ